jgi:two-component system chemotaxis sensor kinase CheA
MDVGKYKELYLTEAHRQVAVMEDGVAALRESRAESELLLGIGRAAHTLKGMSATMGYEELAQLAGEVERVMESSGLQTVAGASEFGDLLADCTDALRLLLQRVVDGSAREVELGVLLRRMELFT